MKNQFEQSEQFEPKVVSEEIGGLLAEPDVFLLEDRFHSEEKKDTYLRKPDGQLVVNNNNREREIICCIETERSK